MKEIGEQLTMGESLSGGTTNLLRMARSGCRSAVAFVALTLGDQAFATAMYPMPPDKASLGADIVDQVVRQLWLDPALGQGNALVRNVWVEGRVAGSPDTRLAVAAVSLGADSAGRPWGVLGVADPDATTFGLADLELLSRIARRLASYVRARHEMQAQMTSDTRMSLAGDKRQPASQLAPEPAAEPAFQRAAASVPPQSPQASGPIAPGPAPAPAPAAQAPAAQAPAPAAQAPAPAAQAPAPAAQAPAPAAQAPAPAPAPAPTAPESHSALASPPGPVVEAASPEPPTRYEPSPYGDPAGNLFGGEDPVTGLQPLGVLLGRTGRLLGAGADTGGSLVVVAAEIEGTPTPSDAILARVATALRAELRFDDPLAHLDGTCVFIAVVPLVPGGVGADVVHSRLSEALWAAVSGSDAAVRVAHVLVDLSASYDADELLRLAVGKLRAS